MKTNLETNSVAEPTLGPGISISSSVITYVQTKDDLCRGTLIEVIRLLNTIEDFADKARIIRATVAYFGLEEELSN